MNRIEALQAAFNIAGPNVTAGEHIQYAEFLLGDESTEPEMVSTWHIVDPREYNPDLFAYKIGEQVYEHNDDIYHVGAVARDFDGDVWVKTEDDWELYYSDNGELSPGNRGIENVARYQSVLVA